MAHTGAGKDKRVNKFIVPQTQDKWHRSHWRKTNRKSIGQGDEISYG